MWPFKKKMQLRESAPFTDAIVAAIVNQAGGTVTPDVVSTAAVEMAAGSYARAFASAEVKASERAQAVLSPSTLALIARDLIRRGESIHIIEVMGGDFGLIPAGSWDVRGGWQEDSWTYRCDLFGPSGNITKLVSSDGVIHCRYTVDASRPWLGLSPLQWAASTGVLAANLEHRLGQEAGGPVGHLIPVPIDPGDPGDDTTPAPLDALRKDIATLNGRNVVLESTAAGWGEGKAAAPLGDWTQKRIGADPPETLQILRSEAGMAVLGACGVPPSLFAVSENAQAARESWRRFIYGSVEPLAALIAEELSNKLEEDVSFSFTNAWAADLAGRATAFKKLVEGGMDVAKAAGASGVLVD